MFAAGMRNSVRFRPDFEVASCSAAPPARVGCVGSAGDHGEAITVSGGTLRDAFVFACSLTQFKAGDMDCDDDLDMDDVAPFVEALLAPAQYAAGFPDCDVRNADINGDAEVDGRDIDAFVQLLTGS